MNEFKQVFDRAQQFLILQAYIDSQLSEEELMNFTLLETTDGVPVVFYPKGVMLIQPALDLNQFTHEFFLPEEINLLQEANQLMVKLSDRKLHFHFETAAEAETFINDLSYLYSR